TALNCAKSGLINSPDDLMLFERADERVKLVHGQIPRPKLSPMCRVPGNNYAETSTQHSAASDQRALSGVWLSTRLDTRARQKVSPAGRHRSSLITLRLSSVSRPGRKKACNAPKHHSSRLCRASVFIPVVAQSIQDMSAVSITHKTVGNRFAVSVVRSSRMANKAPDKIASGPQQVVIFKGRVLWHNRCAGR